MVKRLTLADRKLFIPAGANKVVDKYSDAVVYLYTTKKGKPAAMLFLGKKAKPVADFWYNSLPEREVAVMMVFEERQRIAELHKKQDEREAAKADKNKLVVGDILVSSWGYDQTNVDFYQVVGLVGKCSLKLRKIRGYKQYEGNMIGHVVPQTDDFIGEEFTKRWLVDHAKITSFSYAYKWNTGTVAGVPVGPDMEFSEYA